jgi:histidine triad (HIT) family protein
VDSIDFEPECVFCQIKAKTHEAAWVYEGPEVLAFLDRSPLFDGHVLVVPRDHWRNVFEMPAELVKELFGHVQRVAMAVKTAMDCDGVFVASNNGVSQSVDHMHVHVVPRRKKDGLRGFMWPRHKYESMNVAKEIAARIAGALDE